MMNTALNVCLVCTATVFVLQAAEPLDPFTPDPAALETWRNRRFGMFIHWGPVSLTGHEIGWSRGRETPIAEYDRLYQRFNPEQFDADDWARTAQDAGMKYLILTTKHHDGFCLWPSDYTDYDIGNSPFKRDVLQELSEACRRHDIAFGAYYSVCDWHHPDFPRGSPGGKTGKPHPNLDRYVDYLRNQVTELIEMYGPLCALWFDVPQDVGPEHGRPTIERVRGLQPDIIINNRAYYEKGTTQGASRQEKVGDYSTPEQRVGGFDRERPWETCMTICRQWAWKPDDEMKSLQQCVRILLRVVGGDGNFLFNVGPMPDGRIEPRQVERLQEMGAWLDQFGEGVYGTRGGPFKPGRWGASTCRDNHLYLFIMEWPTSGTLALPALPMKITDARTLTKGLVRIRQRADELLLSLPAEGHEEIASVVRLTVDGTAFDLPPVDVFPFGIPIKIKSAKASNVFRGLAKYQAQAAVDGLENTRWATDAGTRTAWIEMDLGAPHEVGSVMIQEAVADRIQAFELQRLEGEAWRTFYTGQTVGENADVSFPPVTARHIRLNITRATEGPTLWEIQCFKP